MSRETLDVLLQFGPFAVLLVAAGAIVAAIIGAANAWAVAWFNARASRQVAIDAAHREYRKEWCAVPPSVPARVRQALRVCLRKDSKQRVGDIRDVRLASGEGESRLWLRSLVTTTAEPLAGTEGAMFPFWAARQPVHRLLRRGRAEAARSRRRRPADPGSGRQR